MRRQEGLWRRCDAPSGVTLLEEKLESDEYKTNPELLTLELVETRFGWGEKRVK